MYLLICAGLQASTISEGWAGQSLIHPRRVVMLHLLVASCKNISDFIFEANSRHSALYVLIIIRLVSDAFGVAVSFSGDF